MQNPDDSFQQQQQHQFKQLQNRISYTDDPQSNAVKNLNDKIQIRKYKYNPQSIQPFLYFFKLLALKSCNKNHRNKLILNIPDTIIFNDKDNPIMWFYTNSKGEVSRLDNINYTTIMEKFMENAFEKELVAVLKKPSYGYGGVTGNDVKVVSACQIKTVLSSVLSMRSQTNVIQRFVKASSVKSSIMRTCWRSNNSHEGWVLTSNFGYTSMAKINEISKFIVNTKHHNTFTAIKCGSDKHLQETLKYVKNIVKFVQGHLGIKFVQMVCDFIRDEGGNWWYINTKAFILQDPDQKVQIQKIYNHDCEVFEEGQKKKLESYTKCKKCKYCYKVVAEHLMTHKLTLMMILQCDQNLIKMGKKYSWLERCYSHHVGSVNLYVEHKVCDSCYKFYKQVERLIKLQQQLAKLTGTKLSTDNKNVVSITAVPYFKGHPPQFGSRLQKVQYDTQMPEQWNLPQNQEIKIQLNTTKSIYKRCRFMIFIHGIRDIPREILQKSHKYYLTYEFLQQNAKYLLNFNENCIQDNVENQEMFNIQLNKMKLNYFFIENRQEIVDFLKNQQTLKITLYEDEQVLGKIQMELNDFRSDKVIKRDYFKMFSGKNIFPYLSWGLFATLGLHEGVQIQTSSLKLSKKNGLLFPEAQYHSPDPLPQDWIQFIEQKNDKYEPSVLKNNQHQLGLNSAKQIPEQNTSVFKNFLDEEINKYSKQSSKNGLSQVNKATNSFNGSSSNFNQKIKRKPYY